MIPAATIILYVTYKLKDWKKTELSGSEGLYFIENTTIEMEDKTANIVIIIFIILVFYTLDLFNRKIPSYLDFFALWNWHELCIIYRDR